MTGSQRTRRRWLAGLAVSLTAGVAGCGSLRSDPVTPTREPYANLRDERVYVADPLSITLPDVVTETSTPDEADVLVLPATTDQSAETAVGSLAAGDHLILLGHESEDTFHEWKASDAYVEAFGRPEGRAESRAGSGSSGGSGSGTGAEGESPELVAAWAASDDRVTTYRTTWGHTDDPSDEEVLDAVEAALDDGEAGTTVD